MIEYVFSPKWFYGVDIVFEIFSLVIAFLVSRYGYKLYKISNEKKHKYFSVFFFLIGISFIFKIVTNFDIYYVDVNSVRILNTMFYYTTSHISEILFIVGFSVFRFLMLFSFFGLLYITWKKNRSVFLLGLYFIAVITMFSHNVYYIFHITMVVILSMLFYYYYNNYKKHRKIRETFLIMVSFFVLVLSQLSFAAITLSTIMYVIGEILQLIGYGILLYNYILVTRNEK